LRMLKMVAIFLIPNGTKGPMATQTQLVSTVISARVTLIASPRMLWHAAGEDPNM
jgi:hypothetical protein